ncbi:MAG TPA: VOC family protein [Bryobacteraceae bacterium]|nr:VOC family protein [Bryobacteraceae bacterium]
MPAAKKPKKAAPELAFNHAMIYVRDVAVALQFYKDLLGFKLIEQYGPSYARLRATKGQGSIALHRAEANQPVHSDGVRLYFEIKDLDKFCVRLQKSGALSEPPKMMPWGWRHVYLNDPDGHEISLYWAGRKRLQKTVMRKSAAR